MCAKKTSWDFIRLAWLRQRGIDSLTEIHAVGSVGGFPITRIIMVSNGWAICLRCFLLAVLLAMVGCQSAPVQEMSDARQAITVAKEAGAAEHAASDLRAAEEHLSSAEQSLGNRHYAKARDEALQAKARALFATKVSEENQEIDNE